MARDPDAPRLLFEAGAPSALEYLERLLDDGQLYRPSEHSSSRWAAETDRPRIYSHGTSCCFHRDRHLHTVLLSVPVSATPTPLTRPGACSHIGRSRLGRRGPCRSQAWPDPGPWLRTRRSEWR